MYSGCSRCFFHCLMLLMFSLVSMSSMAADSSCSSGNSWVSTYAADFSSVSGYTKVAILNMNATAQSVKVEFFGSDGVSVGSDTKLLATGNSWVIGTANAPGTKLATGDFEGYVKIVSLTGGDILPHGAFHIPSEGNTALANSKSLPSFQLTFYPF